MTTSPARLPTSAPLKLASPILTTAPAGSPGSRSTAKPEFRSWPVGLHLLEWGRHSCLPVGATFQSPRGRTGKSGEPAGWKACPTFAAYYRPFRGIHAHDDYDFFHFFYGACSLTLKLEP